MADEDNGGGWIWFVAGAALGAAVGLMYAPASGQETRRKIAEEGRQAFANQSWGDLIDKGRDIYERGRQLADDTAEIFERGRKLLEGVTGAGGGEGSTASAEASPGGTRASY